MSVVARLLVATASVGWVLVARLLHLEIRDAGSDGDRLTSYFVFAGITLMGCGLVGAPSRLPDRARWVMTALLGSLICLVAGATVGFFSPNSLPRFAIVLSAAGMFPILMAGSAMLSAVSQRSVRETQVIAMVDDADAAMLDADADGGRMPSKHFSVASVVPIGKAELLRQTAEQLPNGILVLSPQALIDPAVVDVAERLHAQGLRVRTLDDFYDEYLGKLPLTSLDRASLLVDIESVHGSYAPVKRLIDLLGASVGALVMIVILPIVMAGNLIANRGPLFFRQERIGKNGKPFSIWKFRTMSPGADDVSGWTRNDDPRITGFGNMMRRTHIDELPQVFNIFAGELSIVGPRPEQVHYVEQLAEKLPFYHTRHLVTPGLTGWAQVNYRYAASEEDAYIKLQYDLHYLRHESFVTDLRIMWMTIQHLLFGRGR
jgi:lipopolysaccharide/colanic/teichoic acid biosynthesis glycosyltransferase